MENKKIGLIWIYIILAAILTYSKLTGNTNISWLPIILLIGVPAIIIVVTLVAIHLVEKKEERDLEKEPWMIRRRQAEKRMEEYDEASEAYLQKSHEQVKQINKEIEETKRAYEERVGHPFP